MLNFFIGILGLDNKARGFLVGYRTYLALGILTLVNLGPALIDLGNILLIFSVILQDVLKFLDGAKFTEVLALVKAQLALMAPLLSHIDICLGALAGAYFKNSRDRAHEKVIETCATTPAQEVKTNG
jgi:hypothetical protein